MIITKKIQLWRWKFDKIINNWKGQKESIKKTINVTMLSIWNTIPSTFTMQYRQQSKVIYGTTICH